VQRQRANAGHKPVSAVAFRPFAGGLAQLVGPSARDLAAQRLGRVLPHELLHVDGAVHEPGHLLGHGRRDGGRSWYDLHRGLCLSFEPDLLRFQIPGEAAPFVAATPPRPALTSTFPTRTVFAMLSCSVSYVGVGYSR
jgi:hypothetical protein